MSQSATSPKNTASAALAGFVALKGILGVLKYKTICSAPKMPFALHPQHFSASRRPKQVSVPEFMKYPG
jgi:hypothetical protein